MTRRLLGICVAILLAMVPAWTASATAQGNTATIQGTVRDVDGAGMPGVTITALNQDTGITQSNISDVAGRFRLPGLPIGMYMVTFELQGFATLLRPDIRLSLDDEIVLYVDMRLSNIQETITVTAETPLIESTKAEFTTTVSGEQINNLPINTRRWLDLALLTPGTSQDNIRGVFYNNVNIGGGVQYYASAFKVDGTNNNWAEMGEPRQNYPADAIAEFKVTPHQFKAEDGLATGGVLNVVTKSGTNRFHGSAFWFFRDDSLNALGTFQSLKLPFRRNQRGATFGGPIVKDKTHFFLSYERTERTDQFTVNTGGAWPAFDGEHNREFFRQMYTLRLDHQFSPSSRFFYRYGNEDEDAPDKIAGGRNNDSLGFAVPRWSHVAGHTWVVNDRAVNEFRFQAAFAMYQVYGSGGRAEYDPTSIDGLSQAELEQHPAWTSCAVQFRYPSLSVGSCNLQMGPEHRYEFRDDFSLFVSGSGAASHDFQVGFDLSIIPFEADTGGQQMRGTWNFPSDKVYDAADPSTFPIRYSAARAAATKITVTHFSPYIQDDWSPSDTLTFNLGLRYDLQHNSFNENIANEARLQGINVPWHNGEVAGFGTTAERGDKNNFGPRFGFAWNPNADGQLVIRGGAGIYYQNIRTLLNFSERLWPAQRSIFIVNPDFPDPFGGLSFDDFVAASIPNINLLANDMRNPRATQLSLGVSKMIGDNSALSVEATSTKTTDLGTRRDVNYAVNGVRPFSQFRRAQMIQSIGESDYKALFVRFERRFRGDHQYLLSYTLSDANEDRLGLPPNQDDLSNLFGPASADRRHRFIASGMASLPAGLQVSGIVSWSSSTPFNPHSGLDLNGDGRGSDYIPGTHYNFGCRGLDLATVNDYRATQGRSSVAEPVCPSFFNVDLRAAKTFEVGRDLRLEMIAQVFNLFNRDNFRNGTGNMRSGSFGVPVSASDKRQLELAVRLRF